MAKRKTKTLGAIAQEAFCQSADKGEWCETNWQRAAAAVEREVLRKLEAEKVRIEKLAQQPTHCEVCKQPNHMCWCID